MFILNTKKQQLMSLVFAFSLIPLTGFADEITDSIDEGTQAYKEGAYSDAVESLNYASQLIQQKKASDMKTLLPEPLEGWKTKEAKAQATGAAMFGGAVTVERKYTKGSSEVSINVVTDSPMTQGMMMMFSNPMFASSDGGKLQKIKRQKAIVKYDEDRQRGEIMIMVANRILVEIKGQKVSREDLMAYAKAVDYKMIESKA